MHEFELIPNRDVRYYTPGFSGFVPQVKAENVFGQSYAKISGMSRQGKIEVKTNDTSHNHWENMRPHEKFRSTFNDTFTNKLAEQKHARPDEILEPGYDTFQYVKNQIRKEYETNVKKQ